MRPGVGLCRGLTRREATRASPWTEDAPDWWTCGPGGWIREPTKAHDLTTRVDFSGDGTRFVTSGLDGRVVLWDGLTGERLAAVQPLGPEFETGVAFLPDGHTVSIAASNGQMFRWDTDPVHGWTTPARWPGATSARRNGAALSGPIPTARRVLSGRQAERGVQASCAEPTHAAVTMRHSVATGLSSDPLTCR